MKLEDIFSTEYLFDPTPNFQSRFFLPLIIFFSGLVALAVVSRFFKNIPKKIADRYFISFLVCGILGLIYSLCRYESLPWIGSRLFLLAIALGLVVWVAISTIINTKQIPKYIQQKSTEDKFKKYLPKSKK